MCSAETPAALTGLPEVDSLIDELRRGIADALGDLLVGLYLYGSLVWGDFDPDVSDIDLLAAVTTELDEQACARLRALHERIARERPAWDDRVEVQYVSLTGLRTFKERTSRIAAISPGEPFEVRDVGRHWLLNWYSVREKGVTLVGPPPRTIIAPISREEFVAAVREHALAWPEWVRDARQRRAQAYAVLTLCRALYACANGEQPSKPQAARWAQSQMPEWAGLIGEALAWRRSEDAPGGATYGAVVAFVDAVRERLLEADKWGSVG